MMSMWPWILLERESCWRWNLITSSSQCHNNPVLVPPRKPPDPVKDLYEGQIYDLKTRVDIWTRMDVVPVEYGTFAQTFHLTMWFFQFITGITDKWDYVIGRSVALLIWIGLWTKLRIYRVPPDPIRWYCRGFGFLWRAFMLHWMLWTKESIQGISQEESQCPLKYEVGDILDESLMSAMWYILSFPYYQEDAVIDPNIFAAAVGL